MTVVQFTGERPQFITGVFSEAYLLRNSSAVTAYLGTDSSLTIPTRALTLEPGASVNWDGKSELWAIGEANTTGTLEYMLGSNTSVTPGPKEIDASIVGLVQVVPQNATNVLAAVTGPLNVGASNPILDTSDLGLYQSIIITAGTPTSAATGATTDVTRLFVEWFDLNGNLIDQQSPYYSSNGILTYTLPIVAPRVRITVVPIGIAGTALPIVVLGSAAALSRKYYNQPGLIGRNVNLTLLAFNDAISTRQIGAHTRNTAAPGLLFLPSYSGPASEIAQVVAYVSGNVDYRVQQLPQSNGTWNDRFLATAISPSARPLPIITAEAPLVLSINATIGTECIFGLSWE